MESDIGLFFTKEELEELKRSFNDSPVVSISGRHYSGKTTLAKRLSQEYGLEHYSMGAFSRELAKRMGVSVEFLPHYWEEHTEDAKDFDTWVSKEAIKEMARGGKQGKGLVVDGSIAGWQSLMLEELGRKNQTRLYLRCDDVSRRMGPNDAATIAMRLERDKKERERWKREFGYEETEEVLARTYNMIIPTDGISAKKVFWKVIALYPRERILGV